MVCDDCIEHGTIDDGHAADHAAALAMLLGKMVEMPGRKRDNCRYAV
jgi:hypothetical protein